MIRFASLFVAITLAMPAVAAERAAQGSLLKTSPPPTRSNTSTKPPPPGAPPLPPAIQTPAIRLLGFTGNKEGPQLPALVTTQPLHLWGATADAAPITTARLLLVGVGSPSVPVTILQTAPIQLWGAP